MPITDADIKLMKSEVLYDTDVGGGRMTSSEVIDGQSNNLFPDISELDRTYGRVALRKAFASVFTPTTESYYGAHAIITKPPVDPRVGVTLFTTKDWADRRTNAKSRVETYLARGVRWPGQVLEQQLVGQRAIILLLKTTDKLPDVGQSVVIIQNEGKGTEVEQYLRVTKVSEVTREFVTENNVRWLGRVVTVEISDPLRYTFSGPAPSVSDSSLSAAVSSGSATLRDTIVANAAVYYGISALAESAIAGQLSVKAKTIWGQLVPSATTEIPLVDLNAAGQSTPVIASADNVVAFSVYVNIGPTNPLYLGNSCTPGTLSIAYSGGTMTDSAGSVVANGASVGSIDYAAGLLTFTTATDFTGTKTVSFKPAAAPVRVSDSAGINIGSNERGYIYTMNLNPPPSPKALLVSYRAQGKWYDLRDQGNLTGSKGVLKGSDSAFGTGEVDYVTGSVVVTLGALPDIDSQVIFFWSTPSNYINRSTQPVRRPILHVVTQNAGIAPSSLTITWPNPLAGQVGQPATLSVSDNGKGVVGGPGLAAEGTVRYNVGEIKLTLALLPLGNTSFTIDYSYGPPLEVTYAHPQRELDGTLKLTGVGGGSLVPGTLEIEWNTLINNYDVISNTPAEMQIAQRTDPTVIKQDVPVDALTGTIADKVGSVIDYVAGNIQWNPDGVVSIPRPRYTVTAIGTAAVPGAGAGVTPVAVFGTSAPAAAVAVGATVYRNTFTHLEYYQAAATYPNDTSGYVKVRYRSATSGTTVQEVATLANLTIDLTEQYGEKIVQGSVRFTFGGRTYVDRLGQLYTDIDPNTGGGSLAGSINYTTGDCEVSMFTSGQSNSLNVQSLLTEYGNYPVDYMLFRVPSAPVRSGTLQIRGSRVDGTNFNIFADATGVFNDQDIHGSVDYQTGVVELRFGQYVAAAGNEAQIWYSANAVYTGSIFHPRPIYADTLRLNAVAFSYMPLSADILGLDPVRLPPDGRVPVFRTGDVVVVHHTTKTIFPTNPSAGDTLNVGRVRLAAAKVVDAGGVPISSALYTVDLDAGIVTLGPTFNYAAFTQPLYCEHRVEDMALSSDVQINGALSLTRTLTHDFPANESYVSSALVIGDMNAALSLSFVQATWSNVWSDAISGNAPAAKYNSTVYPMVIDNKGAIKERWAIVFVNTTTFLVIGESIGQITPTPLSIVDTLAPVNPVTGTPYFILDKNGWGAGWAAGNAFRFNTMAANYPIWVARTVLQGPSTTQNDGFTLQVRGDIDR